MAELPDLDVLFNNAGIMLSDIAAGPMDAAKWFRRSKPT